MVDVSQGIAMTSDSSTIRRPHNIASRTSISPRKSSILMRSSSNSSICLLHRVVDAPDGRGDRAARPEKRLMKLRDPHPVWEVIGDIIGVAALFVLLFGGLFFVGVYQ